MPWNDQSGGGGQGGQGGGQGPWGTGPRRPWGEQPPPRPSAGGPDLEELLRRFRERMRGSGGGGGGRAGRGSDTGGFRLPLIAGILFFGWLMTGVYVVDEGRLGVVTRFGDYNRTTPPGIHMHLPPPFEARQVINVTGQQVAEIGFTAENRGAQQPTLIDRPEESLMITGDRNIVEIHFRAYFNINNVVDYAFNVRDPNEAVRAVAESAMREVIGRGQLETIITTERGAVELAVEQLMQQVLDEYQSGVNVLQVQLLSASAPATVIEAFNDVVNAGSEAQTMINEANRTTATIVNEAQAYRERVVREATGEAERFISVHSEYRQAPQVTRDRLYLETMERVFRDANTMVLDQRGGAVPYLPLEGMQRRPRAGAQPQTPQATEGR